MDKWIYRQIQGQSNGEGKYIEFERRIREKKKGNLIEIPNVGEMVGDNDRYSILRNYF